MAAPRFKTFLDRIAALPDVSVGKWKDTDLLCLFCKGKDFAHFHGETILDIRLSPKIIKHHNLSRSVSEQIHPKRSKTSRWIGIGVETQEEQAMALLLIKQAAAL